MNVKDTSNTLKKLEEMGLELQKKKVLKKFIS